MRQVGAMISLYTSSEQEIAFLPDGVHSFLKNHLNLEYISAMLSGRDWVQHSDKESEQHGKRKAHDEKSDTEKHSYAKRHQGLSAEVAVLCLIYSVDSGASFWMVFWEAMAVYVIVQAIQDLFLTPKIMGKAMGLVVSGRAMIMPSRPSSVPHTDSDSSMMAGLSPMALPMILGVRKRS